MKPYLIKAIYQFCLDKGYTPYMAVYTLYDGVMVPKERILNDQIILNLSPASICNLIMDNESISFSASFSGVHYDVSFPVSAVLGFHARETAEGLMFPVIPVDPEVKSDKQKPTLKIVK